MGCSSSKPAGPLPFPGIEVFLGQQVDAKTELAIGAAPLGMKFKGFIHGDSDIRFVKRGRKQKFLVIAPLIKSANKQGYRRQNVLNPETKEEICHFSRDLTPFILDHKYSCFTPDKQLLFKASLSKDDFLMVTLMRGFDPEDADNDWDGQLLAGPGTKLKVKLKGGPIQMIVPNAGSYGCGMISGSKVTVAPYMDQLIATVLALMMAEIKLINLGIKIGTKVAPPQVKGVAGVGVKAVKYAATTRSDDKRGFKPEQIAIGAAGDFAEGLGEGRGVKGAAKNSASKNLASASDAALSKGGKGSKEKKGGKSKSKKKGKK